MTGVDSFGSITKKLSKRTGSISGAAKRNSTLFTCMTTRAVHLEVTGDVSTDSFILVLLCFKVWKGHPKSIQSNNENNFIGAEGELKDAISKLDQEEIDKWIKRKSNTMDV